MAPLPTPEAKLRNSVMRIFKYRNGRVRVMRAAGFVLGVAILPSLPVDTRADEVQIQFYGSATAVKSFRIGVDHLRSGNKIEAVVAFEQAAENGNAIAQWKLGRMYARGDGVDINHGKAFTYYSHIADKYADAFPGSRYSSVVADAFVALGHYYQSGIKDGSVEINARRARRLYAHAASYFGHPEAQYRLGSMFSDGIGGPKDARQAARWLKLAADKGHIRAQYLLARMLMGGDEIARQPLNGITWLVIANALTRGQNGEIRSAHDGEISALDTTQQKAVMARADAWLAMRPNLYRPR